MRTTVQQRRWQCQNPVMSRWRAPGEWVLEHVEISGPPTLQLAIGGCWEKAQRLPLPAEVSALDDALSAILSHSRGEVAAELIWSGPQIVFVGARYRHETSVLTRTLRGLLDGAANPPTALRALAGGALSAPARVELGAVNGWQSVGPVGFGLQASAAEIRDAVRAHPGLLESGLPLALEVTHEEPRESWWAVQVLTPCEPFEAERLAKFLEPLRAA
jgi:hypothetical protein